MFWQSKRWVFFGDILCGTALTTWEKHSKPPIKPSFLTTCRKNIINLFFFQITAARAWHGDFYRVDLYCENYIFTIIPNKNEKKWLVSLLLSVFFLSYDVIWNTLAYVLSKTNTTEYRDFKILKKNQSSITRRLFSLVVRTMVLWSKGHGFTNSIARLYINTYNLIRSTT